MNNIKVANEILSAARKTREHYQVTGRDFDKIHANMYSIFECYAHGIIDWGQVKTFWKKSIKEYVSLYKGTSYLKEEIEFMKEEYKNKLKEYKPALDSYKTFAEQKLTKNLLNKVEFIGESAATAQSKKYFNERALTESELKDTTSLSWERVMEAYPNLTAKDEARVRMLTIFEGPTVDTTQMITTIVEEPTAITGPMQTSIRPRLRPQMPNSNIGSTERAPNGQMTGSTRGFEDPGFEFNPRAGHRDQPSHPENRGLTPSRLAPTTSPRPKLRPDNLGQRAAINRAVQQAMGETSFEPEQDTRHSERRAREIQDRRLHDQMQDFLRRFSPDDADNGISVPPAAPGNRISLNKAIRQEMGEGYLPEAFGNPEPTPSKSGYPANIDSLQAVKRHIGSGRMDIADALVNSMIGRLMHDNNTEESVDEGYKVLPAIDKERYPEINGLEGPFRTLNGGVVYYDPKEGKYYDKDRDMYLSYDEFRQMDTDYSGMKDERDEVKEAEGEGTYAKVSYEYSEDWWSIEVYKNGKKVADDNGYFGANETGNPLIKKFIDIVKNTGLNPEGLTIVDDEGASGVFKNNRFNWNVVSTNEAMSDQEVDAFHRALDALVHKYIGHGSHEKDDIDERKMTKKEKSKEKRLKKKYDDSDMKASMKKQYGDDWEQVYFATIRKQAMESESNPYASQEIMGEDPPAGIDYDFDNLPKVDWSKYSKEDIQKFVDNLENLDFEDGFQLDGEYHGIYRRAANWVEKNVLSKMETKRRPDHNMQAQMRLQKIMQQAIKDSKKRRGIEDEDEKERTDEMTSAGAIAAVAQPLGKMQRRAKVKEDNTWFKNGVEMCSKECCGQPVTECTCGPTCPHCDCYEKNKAMNESAQMMTEAEFDEAAGEKDACYHKVKSRYKVWPSAYASGALVKCRKVGAKNWGNSKK